MAEKNYAYYPTHNSAGSRAPSYLGVVFVFFLFILTGTKLKVPYLNFYHYLNLRLLTYILKEFLLLFFESYYLRLYFSPIIYFYFHAVADWIIWSLLSTYIQCFLHVIWGYANTLYFASSCLTLCLSMLCLSMLDFFIYAGLYIWYLFILDLTMLDFMLNSYLCWILSVLGYYECRLSIYDLCLKDRIFVSCWIFALTNWPLLVQSSCFLHIYHHYAEGSILKYFKCF